MTSRIALASLVLLACAAPARPSSERLGSISIVPARAASSHPPPSVVPAASASPAPADSASASTDPAPPPLPACNADGVGFAVESPYDLACDEHMRCSGSPRFRVRNCRENSDLVVQLRIVPPGVPSYTLIDLAPIAPGADVIYPLRVGRAGSFPVLAHFTTGDGLEAATMTALIVTASAHDRAVAACEACHGDWGRHGMMQIESCICRTRDAGRECEDPRDCEGECIATGHRVVQRGHPPRRLANGTMSVAETLAVAVGRCSEFRTVFGCHSFIPEGARDRGPQRLFLLPRGIVCRD